MSTVLNSPIRVNPVKFFEEQDNLYLYNVHNSGIFQVDDTIVDICNSDGKTIHEIYEVLKNSYTWDELKVLLTTLENAEVLLLQDSEENKIGDSCNCMPESKGSLP